MEAEGESPISLRLLLLPLTSNLRGHRRYHMVLQGDTALSVRHLFQEQALGSQLPQLASKCHSERYNM